MSSAKRKIQVIDAAGQAPGRIATQIAIWLMGKHKTIFQTHLDVGDKVVVKNAAEVKFTGKKIDQKLYRHHSMHPGGLKEIPAAKMLGEKPEEVIRLAVAKMLPKNKWRTPRLKRLHFK